MYKIFLIDFDVVYVHIIFCIFLFERNGPVFITLYYNFYKLRIIRNTRHTVFVLKNY